MALSPISSPAPPDRLALFHRDVADSCALTRAEHRRLAELLVRASRSATAIDPLTSLYPEMTVADAGSVRDMAIAVRVAAGELVVGAKVTHLDELRLGWLTDQIVHRDGAWIDRALKPETINTRLAVRLLEPLDQPPRRLADLLSRVSTPCACSELVASSFGPSHADIRDVIADNCSTAALLLNDGARVSAGSSRRGAQSLLWLAQELFHYRERIEVDTLLVSRTLEEGM